MSYSFIRDFDGSILQDTVAFVDPTTRVTYTIRNGDARWPDYQAWLTAGNTTSPAPVIGAVKIPPPPGA